MIRNCVLLLVLSIAFSCTAIAGNEPLPCLDKRFSIIAHLVKDNQGDTNVTEADILSAIDQLNIDFSKICISFEVCEFRIVENYQYDDLLFNEESDEITVKNSIPYRINMYFIQSAVGENICGRATLGGIGTSGNVFILKSCIGPDDRTISHEMGHFFGLSHTFEDPLNQLADGTDCLITGDSICDTPADPFIEGTPTTIYVNSDCRFIYNTKDPNGDYYDPHVGNIMSYYPCACEFTDGQYLKMVETYRASNPKNW